MMAHPNGDIYVTDSYRKSRVHCFTRPARQGVGHAGGKAAGEFHLPHKHRDRP
jgi:NHL repeat